MKWIKRGFVLVLALLTGLFFLLSLRDRRQEISVFENRYLAAHPAFSLQSLWNGDWFKGWDKYFSDHVAGRDGMMRDYLWLRLHVKKQLLVNEVMISEEALLPYLGEKDCGGEDFEDLARETADRLEKVRQAVEAQGSLFLYYGVENQSIVFREGYPAYLPTHVDYYTRCAAAFQSVMTERDFPILFSNEVFTAEGGSVKPYYSTVDHHYNFLGAYKSYEAVCLWARARGLELPIAERQSLNIRPAEQEFYGTYNRRLYGLSPVYQPLLIYDETGFPAYERWDEGIRTDAPLLQLPKGEGRIQYTAYMGGDRGETVIETHRPELPSILIVGDSFTNPVEALCVYSFNEVRSLDFRHYEEMSLTEYLRAHPTDLVLVIRDSLNYLGDVGNGDLQ